MSGVAGGSSGGGGSGANALNYTLTKFTSSGTWTKLPTTKSVTVFTWNGGCGGGSGRQGASTAAGGGGGGASGGGTLYNVTADLLNPTETVTIGAGGNGGAAQAGANTDGNIGSVAGLSFFGANIVFDPGPQFSGAGLGGTTTTAAGGSANVTGINKSAFFLYGTESVITPTSAAGGAGSNVAGTTATQSPSNFNIGTVIPAGSGGGGGGADSVVIRSGGAGGLVARIGNTGSAIQQSSLTPYIAGGTAGIESGTINGGDGNPATNLTSGRVSGGGGGGGGGGQSAGGAAGNGGVGGVPGGGGGGGGGSLNGTSSGAGGPGGRGEVWVFEFA